MITTSQNKNQTGRTRYPASRIPGVISEKALGYRARTPSRAVQALEMISYVGANKKAYKPCVVGLSRNPDKSRERREGNEEVERFDCDLPSENLKDLDF
jgi:hypothetical protein